MLTFGPNYVREFRNVIDKYRNRPVQLSIDFPDELLQEISDSIYNHEATSERVLYDDAKQFINVVGESYRQEESRDLAKTHSDIWMAGFLAPEPYNAHDANAVAVFLIKHKREGSSQVLENDVVQGGYLAAGVAKKVHNKIVMFLENDAYIPLICKLNGGIDGKDNFGVTARVMSKRIKFPDN